MVVRWGAVEDAGLCPCQRGMKGASADQPPTRVSSEHVSLDKILAQCQEKLGLFPVPGIWRRRLLPS